ncbi:MAG: lysozyme inhibitor LprI family protein, partial [Xanthobacteraceae bacterium]
DALLNENYKKLLGTLDDQQSEKLRAMQRAWIAYRDTTCNFYWDKIQGTMAGPMISACEARETARRAVLLQFFSTL